MTVARDNQSLDLAIAPYYNEEYRTWQIGILPLVTHQNVFTAIRLGFVQSVQFTVLLVHSLVQMITGEIPAEVAGPVGIVTIIGQARAYGLKSLLILTAYLSINLGLINLFPLPALDGSRLVFLAVEKLRGRPLDQRKEGMVHFVGLIMLFGLMIIITYQDIMRLITGN